jgi:Protein kinase domain
VKPLAGEDPQQVGEFRLGKLLGQGGMGRVFLGRSLVSGRPVAVKIIRPEFASDPSFMARFRREVEAVSVVSGAFTAPPVAAGLDDTPPWVATEFIPGPSLRALVAAAPPLPEAAVWNLAGSLVEALREIHRHGLVHRDLKPENILMAADGPRVIDFGVSRDVGRNSVTDTRGLIGTLLYMSPEQLSSSRVNQASDVFALGSVLTFAATGKEPFAADSDAAILFRIAHEDPDLSALLPGLRRLVAGCLIKDQVLRPSLNQLSSAIKAGRSAFPETASGKYWPDPVAGLVESMMAQAGMAAPAAPAAPGTVRLDPGPAAEPDRRTVKQHTSSEAQALQPAGAATGPVPEPGTQGPPHGSPPRDGRRRRIARHGRQVTALCLGVIVIAAGVTAMVLVLRHKPAGTFLANTGSAKQASANLFARVTASGSLMGGNGVVRVTGDAGHYNVVFSSNVRGCAYVATTILQGVQFPPLEDFTASGHLGPDSVSVEIQNEAGGFTAGAFNLVVDCGEPGWSYAVVGYNANLVRATPGTQLGSLGFGRYDVKFPTSVVNCAYLATVGDPGNGQISEPNGVYTGSGPDPQIVYIETKNPAGGLTAGVPFHLAVVCPGAADTRTAVIAANGTLNRGSGLDPTHLSTGLYELSADAGNLSSCAVVAARGSDDTSVPYEPTTVQVETVSTSRFVVMVEVLQELGGSLADETFHAAVVC